MVLVGSPVLPLGSFPNCSLANLVVFYLLLAGSEPLDLFCHSHLPILSASCHGKGQQSSSQAPVSDQLWWASPALISAYMPMTSLLFCSLWYILCIIPLSLTWSLTWVQHLESSGTSEAQCLSSKDILPLIMGTVGHWRQEPDCNIRIQDGLSMEQVLSSESFWDKCPSLSQWLASGKCVRLQYDARHWENKCGPVFLLNTCKTEKLS